MTIETLQDKTSSARRYSIQLLSKLLETHPFGALHGGTLNLPEWQERYDAVSAELAKVDAIELEKAKRDVGYVSDEGDEIGVKKGGEGEDEEEEEQVEGQDADEDEDMEDEATGESQDPDGVPRSSKKKSQKSKLKARPSQLDVASLEAEQSTLNPELVQRLRLTKKYYADALKFINQLEKAIPQLCILLVSTTKSEVLESMKFFRTAYEYNIQGAEQGIKRMLHLIWTKDNNAPVVTGAPAAGAGAGGASGQASGHKDADAGMVQEREQVDERSVKGQVIETYKSLYFDAVEGLSGKQQVSRIAKNMIE
jgi:condensin complex subunit 1